MRKCEYCGGVILEGSRRRKYCTRDCSNKSKTKRAKTKTKICEQCGKEFESKNWGGGYATLCSYSCAGKKGNVGRAHERVKVRI